MSRIVIKKEEEEEGSPWRRIGLTVLVLALLVSAWGIFEYGRYRAGYDRISFKDIRQKLEQSNATFEAELRKLRKEKLDLEQTMRIESQAYAQVRKDLMGLQDELLELKEELEFYRGIVSPNDANRGLQIQRFTVAKGSGERSWHYKLVLTRVLKNRGTARGTAEILVEGVSTESGITKQLALSGISVPRVQQLRYNFKYFQNIEGEIELPAGFIPSRAILILRPGGKGNKTQLKKIFDWPEKA